MTASTSDPPEEDPKVQMNVRVKRSLRNDIDARRAPLGLSRDEWVARALKWALNQPPGTRSSAVTTAIRKRTVGRHR